jgi:4-aminobutyrate aminotransferase-like enzyme/Ser/Thr protein kinase RdoA (MazF antagonist)
MSALVDANNTLQPEPVDPDDLLALLATHFPSLLPPAGTPLSLTALPGELDANFKLTTPGGTFAVKLVHSTRTEDQLDLQISMLAHTAARAPALGVPRVVRCADGAAFARVAVRGGPPRLLWVLEWREGTALALARPHTRALHASLGGALAELHVALDGFCHNAAARPGFKWALERAPWIAAHAASITPPARRALVERALAEWRARAVPLLPGLRRAVLHGGANAHSVLTAAPRGGAPVACALVGFGDAREGPLVEEVAVAAACAALGARAPLDAALAVAAGFHARVALSEAEADVFVPALVLRLAVGVVDAARRAPDDAPVTASQAPAWTALERLAALPPDFCQEAARAALGLPAARAPGAAAAAAAALRAADAAPGAAPPAPALAPAAAAAAAHTFGEGDTDGDGAPADDFDWGALAGAPAAAPAPHVRVAHFGALRPARAPAASTPAAELDLGVEPAAMLLGAALCAPPGTPLFAARAAHVLAARADTGALVLLLEPGAAALEAAPGASVLCLLWRGLALAPGVAVGALLPAGAPLGAAREGGAAVSVQAIAGAGAARHAVMACAGAPAALPLWGRASDAAAWRALLADPQEAAGLPAAPRAAPPSAAETLAECSARFGPNAQQRALPIKATRGAGAFLFDACGAVFLDALDGPSVGHAHPRVARAVSGALARLQTSTHCLHDGVLAYARELTALLPAPLSVCFFVASGSEANDLALRLARAATGREGVIVLADAYHGHTQALIDVSMHDGPGGAPPHVTVVPCPSRDGVDADDADAGARDADAGVGAALRAGAVPGAFIAESLMFSPGFLAASYAAVRAAGGVCIADEVRTGLGRLGDGEGFFGFAGEGVDIVTFGESLGSGFPMGAVVTTPAIAAAFGSEPFCTGGGPAAAAAGRAVLAVLRDEALPANAGAVGGRLKAALAALRERHAPLVGDVRGRGLFLGVELVRDAATKEPATEEAAYVVARLRERGVLVGVEGPARNVITIRPPLVFSDRDAELLVRALDEVLGEDGLRGGGGGGGGLWSLPA